ncbi:SH3 domain-containing protein [Neorhizobium sp. NPDC001467]|uniref:SH3 domain-containing protein n=1 Tax=Neorhizobium sp. NPDC001467 TaxID=3390595 RepID=UPI003D0914C7
MKKFILAAAATSALMAAPSLAEAAVRGVATANVNMRSGPSTGYPAVTVVPVGAPITVHGCMSNVNWCDVSFVGGRGWVSGSYISTTYRQNRVYVEPDYYRSLGIPTVTFEVDNYWGRYYRDRDFYRDRDRWDRRPPPPPPRWTRDDRRGPPPGWDRDDRRGPPPGWDRGNDRGNWDRDRDRDRDRGDWNRGNDDRRGPPQGWTGGNDDRRGPPPGADRRDDRRGPPPGAGRGDDRPAPQGRERGGPTLLPLDPSDPNN